MRLERLSGGRTLRSFRFDCASQASTHLAAAAGLVVNDSPLARDFCCAATCSIWLGVSATRMARLRTTYRHSVCQLCPFVNHVFDLAAVATTGASPSAAPRMPTQSRSPRGEDGGKASSAQTRSAESISCMAMDRPQSRFSEIRRKRNELCCLFRPCPYMSDRHGLDPSVHHINVPFRNISDTSKGHKHL